MRDTGGDDAYSRARRDPDFLAAVQAVYAGRRNVLNALWWLSRPADAAPDGSPPPLDELRELQRRVFSASGGSLGDPTATRALRALEAELAAEREAITDAVDAADSGHGPGLESLFPVDLGVDLSAAAAAPPGETGWYEGAFPVVETTARSAGRRRTLLMASGLVVALAVGVAIGTQLAGERVEAAPPAAPTPSIAAGETCAQVSDILTILRNAQASLIEERSTEQEWQGAVAVASRVVNRVEVAGGAELSKGIEGLKTELARVNTVAPGQVFELSTQSDVSFQNVGHACDLAGTSLAVSSWTGG